MDKTKKTKIEREAKEADDIMKLNAKAAVSSICELSQNAQSESVRLQAAKEIIAYVKAAQEQNKESAGQIIKLIEGLMDKEDG